MNPLCPYCKVLMRTKFRTWTDKSFGIFQQSGAKVWECPRCKRRWPKGKHIIIQGTEIGKGK